MVLLGVLIPSRVESKLNEKYPGLSGVFFENEKCRLGFKVIRNTFTNIVQSQMSLTFQVVFTFI